jgi:hypothetical protein
LSQSRWFFAALMLVVAGALSQAQEEEKPADDLDKEATTKLLLKAEDEYRSYYKKPETVIEHWAAMKFEIDVGKYDLAALHLKLLLEKQPPEEVDAALARIEAVEGMASFMRLTRVKKWSDHPPFQKEALKNVDQLLDRLTAAVDRTLSDPARFKKFIPNLDAPTQEERNYAFVQIERSKARAGSYLIDALRDSAGARLHDRIVEAMVRFHPDTVPGWIEALKAVDRRDALNDDLRLTLLEIIDRRQEKRAIPYLWHPAESTMYPAIINSKAKMVLGRLLNMAPEKLPPSKLPLTDLAERYYQHRVPFPGKTVEIWPWDGGEVATKPVHLTPRQAEEFFGRRYAREALDIEPTYLPAQLVLLSLTLDRAYGANLEEALLRPMPPGLQQLVGSIDATLLLRALERALDEGNVPVIIAATQALGERGDIRSARATVGGKPQGIVRALYFPDRRVQYVAARALLGIPGQQPPVAAHRVVEVMSRFVAASPHSMAIAAYVPQAEEADFRKGIKEAGFEPVLVRDIKAAFGKLKGSSDYDIVFLHDAAGAELPHALAQLRADPDLGRLPIVVFTRKDSEVFVTKVAARYPNVRVVPDTLVMLGADLKLTAESAIAETAGAPLSASERTALRRGALDALWRMARNEIPGYDVRPALDAVLIALRDPELAPEALEIMSRLPGNEPQGRLANVVLDVTRDKVRIPAAIELNRHIQKHGVLLETGQIRQLKQAYQTAKEPAFRAQLAMVMGALNPSAQLTGTRLFDFTPEIPAPPAEKKEEEKKGEEKK